MSNFEKLMHTLTINVISILLGNNFNFILFYCSSFIKTKIEPLLSALSEISNVLTCYNLLNIIRENALCFAQVTSLHGHIRFFRKSSHLNSVTQARAHR